MKYIHGNFQLALSGNIIVIRATGPWNENCVKDFQAEYKHITTPLIGHASWADLVVVDGESLFVPEAEYLLNGGLPDSIASGLKHVAVVLGKSTTKICTRAQFSNIYRGTDIQFQFFNDEQTAINWLKSNEFELESEQLVS